MLRKLSLAILALLLAAGCGAKPPAPATPSEAKQAADPARPLKKVSLVLDWYPNAVHTPVLAAEQQGYFQAEGLEVEIKMPADNPTDGIKLVGAGKETFAFYYQPDTLQARDQGIPVVSVAAIVRRPLNGIMVPANSGIKSPKELEGKQVGFAGIPLQEGIVSTMVKTAGGDFGKVKLVDVGWDLIPALATKRVDAISGGYINHEKLLLEKQGIPITFFAPADFGVPNYYELVLIAGEQTVKADRATVEAFLRALTRGFAWVKQHKAEALDLLMARQSKEFPLDKDVEQRSLDMLLPWMEEPGVKFGAQKAEDWEKVAAWMKGQGVLKASLNPAEAFVPVVQ
jgi:putative hydroxymethylpyrimidine transport system substrate-binding protein